VPIEPFGELFGLERLPGAAARKEPFAVGVTGAGQVVAFSDESVDEHAERGRDREQVIPDAESEAAVGGLEVGPSQSVDAAEWQRIEQHQAPRHPIDQGNGVIVEEVGEQVEPPRFGDAHSSTTTFDR
jgi:hypothetical protein